MVGYSNWMCVCFLVWRRASSVPHFMPHSSSKLAYIHCFHSTEMLSQLKISWIEWFPSNVPLGLFHNYISNANTNTNATHHHHHLHCSHNFPHFNEFCFSFMSQSIVKEAMYTSVRVCVCALIFHGYISLHTRSAFHILRKLVYFHLVLFNIRRHFCVSICFDWFKYSY